MRKISTYLLLFMAAILLLLPILCSAQDAYTRIYRVDSLGTNKWYLAQIDTWVAQVPSFSTDSTKSVQENRFFAASKAELISMISNLRQQAVDQKSAAERDVVRADSMYAKLSSLYAKLTDSTPDTYPLRRSTSAPPPAAITPAKQASPTEQKPKQKPKKKQ